MLLILSILAILVGPIALSWFPHSRRLDNFLFSFVLISIGGILLLDIFPALWQQIGWQLLPFALLGFWGPSLIESSFRKAADKAHKLALALGILGLALHSILDGLAIIEDQHNAMVPYAVVLHRLVVGLSIWWLVEPIWGKFRTYSVFALLILATLIGYGFGSGIFFDSVNLEPHKVSNAVWLDYFQALIAGTLLHVIIHRPHIDEDGHHHDHSHALEHDPSHKHSHGIVIKHKSLFVTGAICALLLISFLHQLH
ncbi:hypothetical protein [Kangiella sp. TOML190]|uniref:hypothetical protein n=1 Tax=Kangiella sp. TOML190 TaxID=2931351 RepID=UPI00203DD48A|nr:hypothetical protein [Kangiella sp. TOML190]